MLHRKRFELALEKLKSSDWARFEEFASAFLTSEFPELRTVASPSGDEGRDAELFSPEGESSVVLQYSVSSDWRTKIRNTAKKITKNLPAATQLIYVTNQQIGTGADTLKKELRKSFSIALDVRDRSFFLDRYEGDVHQEQVAANLARDVVDPLLESKEVINKKAQALTPGENRAALVFLELQLEDDNREKGLTKTAFDALVRTALRSTHADARLSRTAIHDLVCSHLPTHPKDFVISETDKSLVRLTKKYIRHYESPDEFCLTFEESERLKTRLEKIGIDDQHLHDEIRNILKTVVSLENISSEEQIETLLAICRSSIEKFLFQRGELFVSALENGQLHSIGFDSVRKIVENEYKLQGSKIKHNEITTDHLATVVERALTSPGVAIAKYLRDIADAYTLLAFLQQTPDVQSAVSKIFSDGEIWIDTSIALPLLAESLLPQEQSQFSRLISISHEAGLKFKVTPGVIEEVERHINRSYACSASTNGAWRGAYPYLFAFYIATGSAQSNFTSWLEQFRGAARPDEDISDYLNEFFHIKTEEISKDADNADSELRIAVKEIWTQIHNDRRNRIGQDFDSILALRLAEHDTENYVGVIVRRKSEGSSAFGHTSWWLTLDHMAFEVNSRIADRLNRKPPSSPVMSADFLTNFLAFGPLRGKVSKIQKGALPVAIDPALVEYLTPELVALAKTVRNESKDNPEHVIRRKVRDALDDARRRTGDVTKRGLSVAIDNAV